MRLFVASMRSQKETIETQRLNSVRPALGAIDKVMSNYELQMNKIATDEQRKLPDNKGLKPNLPMELPGASFLRTDLVDKIIPIFDMVIGILLIVGLLTRVASLAAAAFLISVVLSQFPGFAGTTPTYYQAIEAMACLVLFSTDAGRDTQVWIFCRGACGNLRDKRNPRWLRDRKSRGANVRNRRF